MAEERRFPTSFRETETDEPGLVLTDGGEVELVKPDGSREAVGSGSQPVGPGDQFVFVGQGAQIAVPGGAAKGVVLDTILLDPEGWLGSGSYASPNWWGATFAQGSWLLLPAGIYWAEVSYQWSADPGATQVWFADIDDRFNDNIDLWQGDSDNPLHNSLDLSSISPAFVWRWSSPFRVKETGAPYHWGLVAQHSQETDQTLQTIKCSVMRLSQFGGT